MKPVVRRLLLKGFRSIPEACIEFDNPTIFVGRNGSGKSNVVSAFSFLADAMRMPLQTAFDRLGGVASVRNRTSIGRPPNLAMRIELGGKLRGVYAFEVTMRRAEGFTVVRERCVFTEGKERSWFDRARNDFRSNVPGLHPSIDAASLALPLVGGVKAFNRLWRALSRMRVYAVDPGRLREMQEPDSGVELMPDGSNTASVLERIKTHGPRDFKHISQYLEVIVPHTKQVSVRRFGRNLALEITQQWRKDEATRKVGFGGSNISDGTLRAIGLLAAMYQRPKPRLIAVEEPEMTIHPGALGVVFDLLLEASERMQVIVTTHSPELLDEKEIRDRHLRMVEWREGATLVTPVSDANRRALEEGLTEAGGLLRTNALEAAQVSGEDVRRDLFDDVLP